MDVLSTPSQPKLTSSSAASAAASSTAMSPTNSLKPQESGSTDQQQNPETRAPIHEADDPPTAGTEGIPAERETLSEKESVESMKERDGDEEEEEVGECGFCLFMKEGGCKEAFLLWEKCVEEAEKNESDVVEKCFQATQALKKCMEAHSDYYAPILQAEKSMEEEAVKQLEEEKQKERLISESEDKEKEEALASDDSKK